MKTVLSLVGAGAVLGVLHVLTGPDHLSAIATLSANVRNIRTSFWLGVQWGVGHSVGLLLVGVVLIVIHPEADRIEVPKQLSTIFESLVGVFMILLGVYGVRRAFVGKRGLGYDGIEVQLQSSIEDDTLSVSRTSTGNDEDEEVATLNLEDTSMDPNDHIIGDDTGESETTDSSACCGWRRLLAVCAGIVHGLAGPGGVLGVIPAVQLHDSKLAVVYLGTFCTVSSLTMGAFAMCYGSCSATASSTSSREFLIESISACLSILVGLTWIVLLSLGKLDEVFP